MILVIDNYDSFVHNLARYFRELGHDTHVVRNDSVDVEEIAALKPSHIVISPGPCTPNEAGISMAVIERFAGAVPLLGICLGHQCIGQVFGGTVRRGDRPVHGKTAEIEHDGRTIFAGVPSPFTATRYHSLVVDAALPDVLEASAWTEDGVIMGLRHRELAVEGLQFHPESVLTVAGEALMRNFLEVSRV